MINFLCITNNLAYFIRIIYSLLFYLNTHEIMIYKMRYFLEKYT